ncbi:DNA helicase MCM8-like [Coccinella septempunctata]|uniref:DNA helicase MCM8-like n=1 Tax=Coccinella septempunctata TaxID=41139 RepID=UPI001D08FA6E|nr:DNA helicase MCM8-like [Coccinella septempunctata]
MSFRGNNSNKKFVFRNKNKSNPKRKILTEVSVIDTEPSHGYYGFKIYFPDEALIDVSILLMEMKMCRRFIDQNNGIFDFNMIQKTKCFVLDYKLLVEEEIFTHWSDFQTELISNTEYILNCFGLAMHQTICEDFISKTEDDSDVTLETFHSNLGKIRAKIINYEPILQLKDLKVNIYEKLSSVRGTVIKASGTKIQCEYLAFSCSSCKGTQMVKQKDSMFTYPLKCLTKGCQFKSNFIPLHSSPHTRTINCQTIKIQELIGNDQYENGRTPRTLECGLTEDLVNSCMPGDDITITGIIKVKKESNMIKNNQPSLFTMCMEGLAVSNNKNRNQGSYGASERITFHMEDYYAIQKIHAEPMLFRYLVQSLCPSIYGHEIVKAGLLLALFGGTNRNSARAESHIMMIGDPGLGKSQMLQACTNVAPRGVYVCGNTSTSSGLTVTLTREGGGDYSLEAGALMLADQGCCCIDEFDKMRNQHSSLLEAMEQQSISIAKAGITCTLPSRTTILAAANPAGGHYNKAKTVAENLKISAPMLSRFDLIFILLDNPDEEIDMLLSRHILAMHSSANNSSMLRSITCRETSTSEQSLRTRLQIHQNESIEFLPHNLFRKYIAYAQKYVNPVLSDGAKEVIKEFYLSLRKRFQTGESTPVTTRQLQSLIRLTQARAKLELREEATTQDAEDIVEIMKRSLSDIFTDETGLLNTTRSQNSTGMSSRNKALRLLTGLQQLSKTTSKSLFTTREIQELGEKISIPSEKFHNLLQTLNIQGYLLYKGSDTYQLLSA